MALEKTITTGQGFISNNAYIVIEKAEYSKGEMAKLLLSCYKDIASRDGGMLPIWSNYYYFDYNYNDSRNIITQGYIAIKNNPEYANCIDV